MTILPRYQVIQKPKNNDGDSIILAAFHSKAHALFWGLKHVERERKYSTEVVDAQNNEAVAA